MSYFLLLTSYQPSYDLLIFKEITPNSDTISTSGLKLLD
jgi:hypothetical protein